MELACVTVIVFRVLVAVNTDTAWYKSTFHTHMFLNMQVIHHCLSLS